MEDNNSHLHDNITILLYISDRSSHRAEQGYQQGDAEVDQ